jgi:hypothetical protein
MLVADLGVHACHLGVLERLDEGDRVAERGQQDVAAGLVGLGLDREAQVVALVEHVLREHVDALLVARQGRLHVLGGVVLGALAAAPHDEGLGAQLGGEVDVAEHLAEREAADAAVVGGEAAVLEDGCAEEVGRHHRHDDAGRVERALEAVDLLLALGVGRAEREEVVVVEGQAVGAEAVEVLDGLDHVEIGAGRPAERVGTGVADRPESEGELVVAGGCGRHVRGPRRRERLLSSPTYALEAVSTRAWPSFLPARASRRASPEEVRAGCMPLSSPVLCCWPQRTW